MNCGVPSLLLMCLDLQAIAATAFLNIATVLSVASRKLPAQMAMVAACVLGVQVLFGLFKVKKLDEQEKLIMGVA